MKTTFFIFHKYITLVILFVIFSGGGGFFLSCKKTTQKDDNSLRVFLIKDKEEMEGGTVTATWNGGSATYEELSQQAKVIIAPNTQVTLTATPDEGYVFMGWGNGLSGTDNPKEFTMTGSKVVSAQFLKGFRLSLLAPTGGGTIHAYKDTAKLTPFDDLNKIPQGSVVYLIAQPETGQDLAFWKDTISDTKKSINGNASYKTSFIMESNNEVSATFGTITTLSYGKPTISGDNIGGFQQSYYESDKVKIIAFKDITYKDTIESGDEIAQGLRVFVKAFVPDGSFDIYWNGSKGKDTMSFKMDNNTTPLSAEFKQFGYTISFKNTGAATPTYSYKYGKMENFASFSNSTTSVVIPRGYNVIFKATTTMPCLWEWTSLNVTTAGLITDVEQNKSLVANSTQEIDLKVDQKL